MAVADTSVTDAIQGRDDACMDCCQGKTIKGAEDKLSAHLISELLVSSRSSGQMEAAPQPQKPRVPLACEDGQGQTRQR